METNPSGICLHPGGLTGGVTWHKNRSGVVKNNNKKKKHLCTEYFYHYIYIKTNDSFLCVATTTLVCPCFEASVFDCWCCCVDFLDMQ